MKKAGKNTFQRPADNPIWGRLKLHTRRGRQYWEIPATLSPAELEHAFHFDRSQNPNAADRVYRAQALRESGSPSRSTAPGSARQAAGKGWDFYRRLQSGDGHWPGDYGGPLFLLPGLVLTAYLTDTPFRAGEQALMRRYMLNHQREDGGWGLHIEGRSTMFGTVLQYVALRLLGMAAAAPELSKARDWIHRQGGATYIPSWGKFYLSVLGVYEWKGCQSLFPEMWSLPSWLPIHPGRYWCHTRMVYLPMAYCYGHRVRGRETPLVRSLRKELYPENYERVDWQAARTRVAPADQYAFPSAFLNGLQRLLHVYERFPNRGWRKKALDFLLEYIEAEDAQTDHINIGPVNQVMNSICIWHAYGSDSAAFRKHVDRWKDYLWIAEDGLKMNGYNGSQLWDAAFAVQAATAGGLEKEFPESILRAYRYIDLTQVREDVPQRKRFFRHASKGGWPFSTRPHGWPITDCTAEALGAILAIHRSGLMDGEAATERIPEERLFQAVDLLLSFQNRNGGWATYELTRTGSWLEWLNPSEVFSGIMIDYPYTECTAACIRALAAFRTSHPDYRAPEIGRAIRKAAAFVRRKQRSDGSWFGSWAVCFTYGTWFGLEALAASGANTFGTDAPRVDPAIERGSRFLLSQQRSDGGWGESFESCLQDRYVPHRDAQIVNTAWAVLGLLAVDYPDPEPIRRGIELLKSRQLADGDWPQEGISGVFNRTCMITYTAYRNVFPIWALGQYGQRFPEE